MTRKYAEWFVLFMWIVIIAGCKSVVLESRWTALPPSIDGGDADWESVPVHAFESLSASVGACNDAEYLYLFISVENPMTAEILRTAGVTLSFAGTKEKEPDLSMHFTGSDTMRPDFDPNDSFWECMTDAQKARFRRRQSEMKSMITVVQGETSVRVSSGGGEGPAAAPVSGRGFYGYEFKIPIQAGGNRLHAVPSRPGETMEIRITPGGRGPDDTEAMRPESRPMEDEGMGMMGRSGGRRFGPMPGNDEIKFMLTLAEASE